MHHDLQQHVAQFFHQVIPIVILDRLHDFVGLFHHAPGKGLVGLRPVPGAAAGRAEDLDDPLQPGESLRIVF